MSSPRALFHHEVPRPLDSTKFARRLVHGASAKEYQNRLEHREPACKVRADRRFGRSRSNRGLLWIACSHKLRKHGHGYRRGLGVRSSGTGKESVPRRGPTLPREACDLSHRVVEGEQDLAAMATARRGDHPASKTPWEGQTTERDHSAERHSAPQTARFYSCSGLHWTEQPNPRAAPSRRLHGDRPQSDTPSCRMSATTQLGVLLSERESFDAQEVTEEANLFFDFGADGRSDFGWGLQHRPGNRAQRGRSHHGVSDVALVLGEISNLLQHDWTCEKMEPTAPAPNSHRAGLDGNRTDSRPPRCHRFRRRGRRRNVPRARSDGPTRVSHPGGFQPVSPGHLQATSSDQPTSTRRRQLNGEIRVQLGRPTGRPFAL